MAISDFCDRQLVNVQFTSPDDRERFVSCLEYFQGGYGDEDDFRKLHGALVSTEKAGCDRLYFLSVPPTVFGSVCSCINQHARAVAPGNTRVLVEKPFGRDSRTFAELNSLTSSAFSEAELFRLDHYLAKQSIQTLHVSCSLIFGIFIERQPPSVAEATYPAQLLFQLSLERALHQECARVVEGGY